MGKALYHSNQDIPNDMLLGNLLFTNLIDMSIPVSDLTGIFKSNNIPESYVKNISQADAFRRASSSIKNRTLHISGNNGYDKVRIEIDEVKCDADSIKRIIGIKRVDEANEDISYEPKGEIVFNRAAGTCVATPYLASTDCDYKQFKDLCNDVESRYAEWSVYHNKDTVRNIINRIISDTHPISLMPTGLCKFIPSGSSDTLYNLKNALHEMSIYSIGQHSAENVMEIIPVIDTEEQRDLIEKNFTIEITDELFSFTQELQQVIQKKQTLSSRTALSYAEKFKFLRKKMEEYEDLLGVYKDVLHMQLKASLDLIDDNTDENE